tara:strand:- start:153 stop:281 length:129 start_codon:yes stop_codon:yes gene_type:complete
MEGEGEEDRYFQTLYFCTKNVEVENAYGHFEGGGGRGVEGEM